MSVSDADHVQAFLVADEVLGKHYRGQWLGTLFGFAILTDERMPKGISVLGSKEGAIVTRDLEPFRLLGREP